MQGINSDNPSSANVDLCHRAGIIRFIHDSVVRSQLNELYLLRKITPHERSALFDGCLTFALLTFALLSTLAFSQH